MTADSDSLKAAPRILLVRLSAIGDVVHGLPVLCALRARWPHAFIAWAVEEPAAAILPGHRALDELISLPRRWPSAPTVIWQLRRRLRRYRFDIAIDLQGLTKSALVVWLAACPRRIGFGGENQREISGCFYTETVIPRAAHVVEQNLELLQAVDIAQAPAIFDLPRQAEAEAKAEAFLRDSNLLEGFAALNPGAGWPSKRWPPSRFAAVARHLGRRHGLRSVVFWAGQEERLRAQQVVAEAEDCALLAPATTLPELISLLHRSRLCIASDTGPLHLAAALGVRSIGLYGPMPAERNGPYGLGHVALQRIRLSGPSRERRRASDLAMLAIASADVCRACDEVLAAGRPCSGGETVK